MSTPAGHEVKVGFLFSCEQNQPVAVCECMFAHITSLPGYNSLATWERLKADVAAYIHTGDRSVFPPALVSAASACRQPA